MLFPSGGERLPAAAAALCVGIVENELCACHILQDVEAVGEDLLVPVCRGGEFVRQSPTLEEIQARCRAQLAALHGGVKRLQHPHAYPAGLERGLADRKAALIYEYRQKIKS